MIYLITHRNYLENVKVRRFASLRGATAELSRVDPDPAVGGFIIDTDSNLGDLGSKTLIDLYNLWREPDDREVAKFESRTVARQRFFARLEARFSKLPEVEDPAQEETTMAKSAAVKKVKTEKTPKAPKAGRELGKPAGLVADFRQVRAGTDRAKVLKMMDGTKTTAQIAKAIEKDDKTVLTVAYCLSRDSGIGYKMEDGKLVAIYPGSKTYEDAIKPASE